MRLTFTLVVGVGILGAFVAGCSHNPISSYRTQKTIRAMGGSCSPFVEDMVKDLRGMIGPDLSDYDPINRIDFGPRARQVDVEALKAVLRRTPKLQRLGLTYMDISDADLVEILEGLPKLSRIELTATGAGAGVVDHLAEHLVRGPARIDLNATCVSPTDITRLRGMHADWEIVWSPLCGEPLREIQAQAKTASISLEPSTTELPTNCVIRSLWFTLRPETMSSLHRLPDLSIPIRELTLFGGQNKLELDALERLDRVEHLVIVRRVDHLSWLSGMDRLQSLSFTGGMMRPSNLADTDWTGLANLPANLTKLTFYKYTLPDDAFAHLKPEGPLRSVGFDYMDISTKHLQALARVKQLERFSAELCTIDGEFVEAFSSLATLEELKAFLSERQARKKIILTEEE